MDTQKHLELRQNSQVYEYYLVVINNLATCTTSGIYIGWLHILRYGCGRVCIKPNLAELNPSHGVYEGVE